MPQMINIPGGTASFPDNMPKEQIEAVLQQHFKESTSQPSTGQAPQQQDNKSVLDPINSLGGGIATGLGNVVNAGVGMGTDIAQGVGAISSDTRDNINSKIAGALTPGAPAQQAMENMPGTAAIGKGIGTIGGAVAATAGMAAMAAGTLGVEAAGIIANGIVGSASSGNGLTERVLGGVVGSGTTVVLNKAAKAVSAIAASQTVKQTVNDVVSYVNSKIEGTPAQTVIQSISNQWNMKSAAVSALFDKFREGQGTSDYGFSKEAHQLTGTALDMLDRFKNTMSGPQINILEDAVNTLKGSSTIADLHDVRMALNEGYGLFKSKEAGQPIFTAFSNLKNQIDSTMESAAKDAGVLQEYQTANHLYKTEIIPLQSIKAKQISGAAKAIQDATENKTPIDMNHASLLNDLMAKYIKPGEGLKAKSLMSLLDETGQNGVRAQVINNAIDKSLSIQVGDITSNQYLKLNNTLSGLKGTYAAVFNTPESKAMVDGLQTVIKTAGPILKALPDQGSFKDIIMHAGVLGTLVTAGSAVINPVAGVALGGVALLAKPLLATPAGQTFLKLVGSSSKGTQIIHNLLNTTAAVSGGAVINKYMQQVHTPPMDPEFESKSNYSPLPTN